MQLFSSNKRLQENVSKITHTPPPSRVKWSAPYHMFIFYLHRQLVLHISGINQNMLHEKMSQCKILIVPDLASLNIVHLQKNILRCVGFCFIRIGISS